MVAKDTSYGSETYKPYLDIERIINIQSSDSVNRGHDLILHMDANLNVLSVISQDAQLMIQKREFGGILISFSTKHICIAEFQE
jgi:hypothetical protein